MSTDLENLLAADETVAQRERAERGIAAMALHESGLSYAEIAAALELTKTTAFRRVQDARRRFRRAAEVLGAELAR